MAPTEYEQGHPFPGVIGRTVQESGPAWPAPRGLPDGAPNVLFFVLDDVGYGQLSCFGGLVETPNIDRVAASGLRYANMHTTALCSPTRASILTGRNHHSSGVACIMELATGYPGYDGRMPFENGMLPEMLVAGGLQHVLPRQVAPLARGGEHAGRPVPPLAARPRLRALLRLPRRRDQPVVSRPHAATTARSRQPKGPEDGYHLSEDLADQAIKMMLDAHVNAPEKPFFMYYATGAAHAPHHVPKEWADRYQGPVRRRLGRVPRDRVRHQKEIGPAPGRTRSSRPRDPDVPEWSTLSADERRLYARMMEVYAGFVSHADHHFGRILDTLEQIGELDNTLIMVVSDNGASAEGGVTGSFNEMRFFNQVPESFEDNLAHDRRPRRHRRPTTTTRGAGRGPATRRSGAGSARPTAAGRPIRSSSPGRPACEAARRDPHAVRARDRHGADRARRARHRAAGARSAACRRRRSRASASRTRSTTADAADRARHPVLRDVRPPRDLPRRLARRVPVARRRASPRPRRSSGASSGTPITPGDPRRARPQRLGALPAWPTTRRESRRRRGRAPGDGPRAGRALVGGGREVQGAAAGRLACRRGWRPSARRRRGRAPASSTTRTARWCRRSPRRRSTTAPTRSRPTSRSRPAASRA